MDIETTSTPEFRAGTLEVGTDVVALDTSRQLYKGVTLKSASHNSAAILVGEFRLYPGDEIEIPIDDPSKVFVSALAQEQILKWWAA